MYIQVWGGVGVGVGYGGPNNIVSRTQKQYGVG